MKIGLKKLPELAKVSFGMKSLFGLIPSLPSKKKIAPVVAPPAQFFYFSDFGNDVLKVYDMATLEFIKDISLAGACSVTGKWEFSIDRERHLAYYVTYNDSTDELFLGVFDLLEETLFATYPDPRSLTLPPAEPWYYFYAYINKALGPIYYGNGTSGYVIDRDTFAFKEEIFDFWNGVHITDEHLYTVIRTVENVSNVPPLSQMTITVTKLKRSDGSLINSNSWTSPSRSYVSSTWEPWMEFFRNATVINSDSLQLVVRDNEFPRLKFLLSNLVCTEESALAWSQPDAGESYYVPECPDILPGAYRNEEGFIYLSLDWHAASLTRTVLLKLNDDLSVAASNSLLGGTYGGEVDFG